MICQILNLNQFQSPVAHDMFTKLNSSFVQSNVDLARLGSNYDYFYFLLLDLRIWEDCYWLVENEARDTGLQHCNHDRNQSDWAGVLILHPLSLIQLLIMINSHDDDQHQQHFLNTPMTHSFIQSPLSLWKHNTSLCSVTNNILG